MSRLRRRGKKFHLYWDVKVFDPINKEYVWKQRSKSISTDSEIFKKFKKKFDYERECKRLGIPNDKKEWVDFKEEILSDKKGKTLLAYQDTFKRFEAITNPVRVYDFTYNHAIAWRRALDKHQYTKRFRSKAPDGSKIYIEKAFPLSNTTKNIDLRNMHATWEEAVRSGCAAENVFHKLETFTVVKRVKKHLDKDVIQKILDTAQVSETPGLYTMCMVLKYTGIRKGELVNLKWKNFDFSRGIMFILGTEEWETKDREEAAFGIPDPLLEELKRWRKHQEETYGPENVPEWVFPGPKGRRGERSLHSLFERLYRRAGIVAKGLNTWRHSFGTHAPISDKLKKAIMRHSDVRTTHGYTHVTPEELASTKKIDY